MSGLAHVLETAGIATTIVALVRPHAEQMRPPRALWVPFELGRPLGTPGNARLQQATLRAALGTFEQIAEPGGIVDFDREQTDREPDPDWQPPSLVANDLATEVAALADLHASAAERRGRTTVGLSGLSVAEAARFVETMREAPTTESPVAGQGAAAVMRFAADDLKAYCYEAAMDAGTLPSTEQLGEWFWANTYAGRAIRALRLSCMESDDKLLKTVGQTALVPREWAERLD